MASNLFQFLFSKNAGLSYREGSFKIGASGATTGLIGSGIANVVRETTGIYRVQMLDNFNRVVGADPMVISPTTGTPVSDGSFSVGTPYQILNASTGVNWQKVGLAPGLTAAAGQTFVASSGAGGDGTGTALRIGNSNVDKIEFMPNPNSILGPLPIQGTTGFTQGAYFFLKTLQNTVQTVSGGTVASTAFVTSATIVPTLVNPSTGTVVRFGIWLRASTVPGTGETSSNY